ncbi:MAG: hypothetical protein LBB76_11225 [Azoarcus sp.]|nr:hypothetical protein [Azoarcus sp.]
MLLEVESGYTDVALLESEAASNAKVVYALEPVKTFMLDRFLDSATTDNIGAATVFGYCFSTRADAKALFHDGTGVCPTPGRYRALVCRTAPQWQAISSHINAIRGARRQRASAPA